MQVFKVFDDLFRRIFKLGLLVICRRNITVRTNRVASMGQVIDPEDRGPVQDIGKKTLYAAKKKIASGALTKV
jgi:hypothetical protein